MFPVVTVAAGSGGRVWMERESGKIWFGLRTVTAVILRVHLSANAGERSCDGHETVFSIRMK